MPELTPEQQKELEEKIKKMSPEELAEFQKQQCIFCQIVAGKVASKAVYSDEKCLVVMDINPAAQGHVLILPKEHYAIMPQVPEGIIGHLFLVAKYFSHVMLRVLKVSGTTLFIANGLVAGQRAQHFMLHLIPRKEGDRLLEAGEVNLAPELPQKIRQVLEPRLNQLLGIKKEVVEASAEKKVPDKMEVEKKEHPQKEKEGTLMGKGWEEVEEKKPKGESEEKEAKSSKLDTLPRKKPGKKKSSPEKPEQTEPDSTSHPSPDTEVSLDDIASLFK